MSMAAWIWLAAFGGFVLGWFLCLVLTRDQNDEAEAEAEIDDLERML